GGVEAERKDIGGEGRNLGERQDEDEAEAAVSLAPLLQDQRQCHADRQLQRQACGGEETRVPERIPEIGILQDLRVVAQSRETDPEIELGQIVREEAEPEIVGERKDKRRRQRDQCRRDEQQA